MPARRDNESKGKRWRAYDKARDGPPPVIQAAHLWEDDPVDAVKDMLRNG
ncbi:hypothetical protein [Chitinophaga rhizophila]|uniref:Ankyrin repeat protein n=1 Tax=Chitinophaga rhizophila TaxID=2866212 RepID=A0ABS7GB00_9BACT|nr:hypothetical protein [Chitinophaga rhizophila]MBW8684435.1 hypothetical protein [Chitinophaga rhizophila]